MLSIYGGRYCHGCGGWFPSGGAVFLKSGMKGREGHARHKAWSKKGGNVLERWCRCWALSLAFLRVFQGCWLFSNKVKSPMGGLIGSPRGLVGHSLLKRLVGEEGLGIFLGQPIVGGFGSSRGFLGGLSLLSVPVGWPEDLSSTSLENMGKKSQVVSSSDSGGGSIANPLEFFFDTLLKAYLKVQR